MIIIRETDADYSSIVDKFIGMLNSVDPTNTNGGVGKNHISGLTENGLSWCGPENTGMWNDDKGKWITIYGNDGTDMTGATINVCLAPVDCARVANALSSKHDEIEAYRAAEHRRLHEVAVLNQKMDDERLLERVKRACSQSPREFIEDAIKTGRVKITNSSANLEQ